MKHQRGWKAWEKEVQELLGLRATVASGSQFHDQGDAQSTEHYTRTEFGLFVDAKYTERRSFSVKEDDMVKVADQAHHTGRMPVLAVRVWPRDQVRSGYVWNGAPMDLAVIGMNDLARLMEGR